MPEPRKPAACCVPTRARATTLQLSQDPTATRERVTVSDTCDMIDSPAVSS